MIQTVHFKNYRCLKSVSLELGEFTVLVGPNSSGKSAVLRALEPKRNLQAEDTWHHDTRLEVSIDLISTRGELSRRCFISSKGRFEGSGIPHSAQLLHLDLLQLRRENHLTECEALSLNGDNLTNVFATLTRKRQEEVAGQLARLVPVFADVTFRPTRAGHAHLTFQDRWNDDVWYTPDEVSDGTMLMLAYIVTQYQTPQVDLLLIEEPERGLHPYLLGELIGLLKRLAHGEIGPKPVQVVLATQSAELLDHVEAGEVRLLSRDASEGTVEIATISADTPDWQAAYREHEGSLGNIWLSGGIGGVPRT